MMDARNLAHALSGAFAPVDAALLGAGDRLGQAVGLLEGINAALEGLQGSLEGPELALATTRLTAAVTAIEALSAGLRAEGDAIGTLGSRLAAVGACIRALTGVTDGLSLLSMNATMVCRELDTGGGELLDFASELGRLTRTCEAELRGYASAQAAGLAQLNRAASAHHEFQQRQGPALGDVASRVRRSLADVAERRGQVAEATGQLRACGQSITAAVGQTVSALQVGDATRQRIEHVVDGFLALDEGLAGAELPWCAGLPMDMRARLSGSGMALQAALLRDAGATLDEETRRITEALGRLAADAAGMVRAGQLLFGSAGARGDSFLSALEGELDAAGVLLAECRARRLAVDEAARAADHMLGALAEELSRIRSLATDLRLIGLNAAFRCGRLGLRGRTLSAIARELRSHAWAVAEGVEALSGAIDAAIGAQQRAAAAGQAGQLEATLAAMQDGIGGLREAGGVMDAAMRQLHRDGKEAAGRLAEIGGGLGAVSQLVRALGLAARQAEAGTRLPPPPAALQRERLGLVNGATFTMAHEREIAREHGADLPEVAVPAPMELEDLLF
jgi:hypothetical protein